MESLDLSPYAYLPFPIPMLAVGWLGPEHGLQASVPQPLLESELAVLRKASSPVASLTLGWHDCDFCPRESAARGNGEYRYYTPEGDVYCAPEMIVHYAEAHGYRPPDVFMKAIATPGPLTWDWRAEKLVAVLFDESGEELRGEVIIDLPNWPDPRVWEALMWATQHWLLAGIAGWEIGVSLSRLLQYDFAKGFRAEDFNSEIQRGLKERLGRPNAGEYR